MKEAMKREGRDRGCKKRVYERKNMISRVLHRGRRHKR
jgi:hypothetical protein